MSFFFGHFGRTLQPTNGTLTRRLNNCATLPLETAFRHCGDRLSLCRHPFGKSCEQPAKPSTPKAFCPIRICVCPQSAMLGRRSLSGEKSRAIAVFVYWRCHPAHYRD
ncbi:hypothetical protein [Picosynechococcus sp. PCC 11901]|uniref:hypothetical protein n=1 Tax=Picosynechococcus sp. PCC 11901 TaxID=2579791 RepID=UPI002106797B|nr:hypothetical protein [Picosynechococcus sp. PCC 11901]